MTEDYSLEIEGEEANEILKDFESVGRKTLRN